MNNKFTKFIEKDNRNPKKYQKKTSKLRINIQQTPRTTFDDIEKRNLKQSKLPLESLIESTHSSFPISRFVTNDANFFHNCHFISEINNYKSRELYFNSIFFFYLRLYLIHIFGVSCLVIFCDISASIIFNCKIFEII